MEALRFRGRRFDAALVGSLLAIAACGSDPDTAAPPPEPTGGASTSAEADPSTGQPSSAAVPVSRPTIEPSPSDVTVSGLSIVGGGSLAGAPPPLVDLREIRSGGPPPDGIPSIDAPQFLSLRQVAFLAENEPVLALDIDGDARAYPVQILMWHEIVNDTVGGIPVAVTYCPLCNSAVAYDRRGGGPHHGVRHVRAAVELGVGHVRPSDRDVVESFHRAGHRR